MPKFIVQRFLLALLTLAGSILGAQTSEICRNGIDDDLDGLLDVFDSDCVCGTTIASKTYVNNPNFEYATECCFVIEIADDNCLSNEQLITWELIEGSPEYYHPDCQDANQVEGVFVNSFTESFILLGTDRNNSEAIGACLSEPLMGGNEYVMQISIALPTESLSGPVNGQRLSIYGLSDDYDCGDLVDVIGNTDQQNISGNFCSNIDDLDAELLVKFADRDLVHQEFLTFNFKFRPLVNISTIILNGDCDNNGQSFFLIRDFQIFEELPQEENWTYNGVWSWEWYYPAETCDDYLRFTIWDDQYDTVDYRWYIDSLLVLETDSTEFLYTTLAESINESFIVHLEVYNENGCEIIGPWEFDSFESNRIVQDTTYLCSGNSFIFAGENIDEAGTYYDTIFGQPLCDTFLIMEVFVGESDNINGTIYSCEGDTVVLNNQIYTSNATHRDTLVTMQGCDSINEILIFFNNAPITTLDTIICEGNHYDFFGNTLSAPGVYFHSIPSSGCDSTIQLNLSFSDTAIDTIRATICQGSEFFYGDSSYTNPGIFNYKQVNDNGCDSMITIILEANQTYSSNLDITICNADYYICNRDTIRASGTYVYNELSQQGCDSTITLQLAIDSQIKTDTLIWKCEFESITFLDSIIEAPGNYIYTLSNQQGCDSIIDLDVMEYPIITDTTMIEISRGESYEVNDMTYEEEGEYIITFQSSQGCDSIVVLQLSVRTPFNYYIPNVLAPTASNANSMFSIQTSVEVDLLEFEVFDRWGGLIYSETEGNLSENEILWDGTSQTQTLNSGIYIYKLRISTPDNEVKDIIGDILVLR